MNPQARPVIKAFAQVLGGLATLVILGAFASFITFSWIFRTRTETPVAGSVALRRLESCWPVPAIRSAKVLSHRKETTWDGTTHEEWVALVPGSTSLDLNQRSSPFLLMDNSRDTWPMPEVAVTSGYAMVSTMVYQAIGRNGGAVSQAPTIADVFVWPAPSGWIVRVQHTLID